MTKARLEPADEIALAASEIADATDARPEGAAADARARAAGLAAGVHQLVAVVVVILVRRAFDHTGMLIIGFRWCIRGLTTT